jgi:hypothetical protein
MQLHLQSEGLYSRLAEMMQCRALSADPAARFCGAVNMWRAALNFDLLQQCKLTFLRIVSNDTKLHEFSPKHIFVAPLQLPVITLWVGKPQPLPADDDFAAPADFDQEHGSEDVDQSQHASDSDLPGDELPPVFDKDDSDIDDLPDRLAEGLAAILGEEFSDWSVGLSSDAASSSSSGPEDEPPAAVVPLDEPPPDAPPPPPAPVLEPVPVMDVIVGVPAAGPPKGRGRGRGRRGGVHVYDHMAYPFKRGHFKVRPHVDYIDVHCDVCGGKMDRKGKEHPNHDRSAKFRAQGRPLGMMLLWLSVECPGNKDLHKDLCKTWALIPGMMFEARVALRDEASTTMPHLNDVFSAERDPLY